MLPETRVLVQGRTLGSGLNVACCRSLKVCWTLTREEKGLLVLVFDDISG